MKALNKSNIYILVHILCWLILAVGVLYNHPGRWDAPIPKTFWTRQTILLVILMGVFYLNYYLLIPRFLIQKKVFTYILIIVTVIVAVTYFSSLINSVFKLELFFRKPHFPGERGGHPDRRGHFDTFVPGLNLLMVGLGITISFIQKWQQEVQLRQQLEQEKVTAELTMLKAQINPHFFFNTLNNIYSYTLSDGDVARTAITNLSKMMRYVLYDSSGGQTPLSKEVAFIQEYTALMKLRISNKTTVTLKVPEFVHEAMIAPMIFLPFVENAFKHGISSMHEGFIYIEILQGEGKVELLVKNTVYESKRAAEDESNGIGIQNTTRRLQLLYPGKYTLSAGMLNPAVYEVKLTLVV
ncbi:sensor histidine kinase [Mucilaginibacter terrae]|uniref:Two-component system LytT family sensor kinase n=1 Tax=Mucilaginibacter terrae TaxID=1955052 RepID=A0ABU3GQ64_9SPHI|nr:histidine kinase [Mucilaginibacter terrae]MDT3401925.1 two-component system LytT family sensor kinase [Mucilaginibacter terrae]